MWKYIAGFSVNSQWCVVTGVCYTGVCYGCAILNLRVARKCCCFCKCVFVCVSVSVRLEEKRIWEHAWLQSLLFCFSPLPPHAHLRTWWNRISKTANCIKFCCEDVNFIIQSGNNCRLPEHFTAENEIPHQHIQETAFWAAACQWQIEHCL